MIKQEELKRIDFFLRLHQALLIGDPELVELSVDIDSIKNEIDSLLDARFLLMQMG
jgi:hypothetical protein